MMKRSPSPLDILHQHGLEAEAKGDRLVVFPAHRLTDDLRCYIRQHKPDLLRELSSEVRKLKLVASNPHRVKETEQRKKIYRVCVDGKLITMIDWRNDPNFEQSLERKFGPNRVTSVTLKEMAGHVNKPKKRGF